MGRSSDDNQGESGKQRKHKFHYGHGHLRHHHTNDGSICQQQRGLIRETEWEDHHLTGQWQLKKCGGC